MEERAATGKIAQDRKRSQKIAEDRVARRNWIERAVDRGNVMGGGIATHAQGREL
jgi:hypothetical protein